MLRRF